jgi:uncharacterized protein YbjT (DUF2867 family)
MVHDPRKAAIARSAGAQETITADLRDRGSLSAALRGVDGVFLITPAFAPDATDLGLGTVEAAIAAGVSKVVYSGVYHPSLGLVNHASTRPVEEALYASDLTFTILEPAMFMQGLAGVWTQAIATGKVVMPWSKRSKMSYVDYRDVAEAAATAFSSSRLDYGTFELAADGMIDRVQLAELMSKAAGVTVTAQDMEGEFRLPPGQPDGLAAMFADYDRHGFHGGNALILRAILEREPRSVAAFLAELATS